MLSPLAKVVQEVTSTIVRELGEGAPPWAVSGVALDPSGLSPSTAHELAELRIDSLYDTSVDSLRGSAAAVTVTLAGAEGDVVTVSFPLSVPASWAIAELASQLQDHAVESASGWARPLPPCPEHRGHPLQAHNDGRRAVWRCPLSEHVVGPIADGVA